MRGQANDGLIIVNQSDQAFPLGMLRLGDGNESVNGEEWGLATINKTECVGVWKNAKGNNKNKMPGGVACTLLGNPVLKDKKGWLGEAQFGVYYDEKQFGVCGKDQKQCLVTITVP